MAWINTLIVLFFVLFLIKSPYLLAVVVSSCEPAEEGTQHNITFKDVPMDIPWLSFSRNETETVANCSLISFKSSSHKWNCTAEIEGIELTSLNDSITVTINNVSRTDAKTEGKWECSSRDRDVFCHLKVYAKPKNASCDPPKLDMRTDQMVVTCTTEKVYPNAGCQFNYSVDNIAYNESHGNITYNDTKMYENPVYYKSQCTLTMPREDLPNASIIYFRVNMYPRLNNSKQRYNVTLGPLRLALGEIGDSSSDHGAVVGLAVTLVLVAVVAVVFAILWFRARQQTNEQQELLGYQAPSLPLPSAPISYCKPEPVGDNSYEMVMMLNNTEPTNPPVDCEYVNVAGVMSQRGNTYVTPQEGYTHDYEM